MRTVLNAFERLAKRQIVKKKKIAVELGVDKTTVNFFKKNCIVCCFYKCL